jgi:ligand-binding SRPBCC domain-containing protein
MYRAIAPLPGAQNICAEAGPPNHGAKWVSGNFACRVVHHDDGTILSTYGQHFARRDLDTMTGPTNGPDVRIDRVTTTQWVLRATQTLAGPRDSVFAFFSDAANLERITPAEMGFRMLTETPIEMMAGTVIDYQIRLHGLRLRWRTLISEWNPPFEFVDVQARGPYAEWVHHHRFTSTPEGGTLVEDEVQFRLPLGLLGTLAAPLVKRQLRRIFTHRYDAISGAFPSPAPRVRVIR